MTFYETVRAYGELSARKKYDDMKGGATISRGLDLHTMVEVLDKLFTQRKKVNIKTALIEEESKAFGRLIK